MVRVILNPYGIAYAMGLQGKGTARANPMPMGLDDYLKLAERLGVRGVEIFTPLLDGVDEGGLARLRERMERREWIVVMSQPLWTGLERSLACARALGAKVVRCHCTPVLCGDRAAPECDWAGHVNRVRLLVAEWGPRLAEHGVSLAIENHQDFTAGELMELCALGGDLAGICFDVGNALSVAEDPVAFAATIAPRVRHIHLKDYRAHWSDEGYRLVRCAIGDGAIPFAEVLKVLDRPDRALAAAIEPGALAARHIRVLSRQWWKGYPQRTAESLAAGLKAARANRMREDAEWRTPWELDSPPQQIVAYEMAQLDRSVTNLKGMGLL